MKNYQKLVIILIILVLIGGGIFLYFSKNLQRSENGNPQSKLNLPKIMKLNSSAFEDNQSIPAKYTCDGEDISPPFDISEVPTETKSLVLIIDDPDAPMGTWDHWIIWNVDSSVSQIKENEVPSGAVEGLNSFKKQSYGGPCPPSGIHHYHFKLYALNKKLELDSSSRKKEVEKEMAGFILDQAELIGLYQR